METASERRCLRHAQACRVVKGEDAFAATPLLDEVDQTWLYAVCDGHIGRTASRFVAANLQPMLASKLRWVTKVPAADDEGLAAFAQRVRQSVCEAFAELDNTMYEELIAAAEDSPSQLPRQASGTAVTAAIILGPLLTVANLGDCHAVLDTGSFHMQLTHSHRLMDSEQELERVREAGCHVAPLAFDHRSPAKGADPGVGPLRLWPGGLCLARGIGDYDTGPHVLPLPHIKQVVLPEDGCRLVLASDGLWDVMSSQKALSLIRNLPIWTTAAELVRVASKDHRVIDDTSVLVVDVLPHKATSFRALTLQKKELEVERMSPRSSAGRLSRSGSGGSGLFQGLISCFSAPAALPATRHAAVDEEREACFVDAGLPHTLADVDCLEEHPDLRAQLLRNAHVSRLDQPFGRSSLAEKPQQLASPVKCMQLQHIVAAGNGTEYSKSAGFTDSTTSSADMDYQDCTGAMKPVAATAQVAAATL